MKKIVKLNAITNCGLGINNKKIVLVGGCFDIFHFGHFTFLSKAKKLGDVLVVTLESDEFIKRHKKKPPIHSQIQRAKILASLGIVDIVVLLPYLDSDQKYSNMVQKIKPSIIALTQGDMTLKQKERQAKEVGAKLVVATTLLPKFSSSRIKNSYETILGD
jgi:rfaE bifunctional protein nucleotidyltransferase chain/domain